MITVSVCLHTIKILLMTFLILCTTFHDLFTQFSSVAQLCLTLCDPIDCSTPVSLSITNSQSLLELMSIESVMPSNHLILCRPLLLLRNLYAGQEATLRTRHGTDRFQIGKGVPQGCILSLCLFTYMQSTS